MGNWIPSQQLDDVELHDIKKLKEGREGPGNNGVMKMLLLTEDNVNKMCREAKGMQLFRAQGIAQFLEELSELLK